MQYSFIKHTVLAGSRNQQEFFHSLRLMGLHPEYKGNVAIGFKDGSKLITWKKIGISPIDFHMLAQRGEIHTLKQRIDRLEQPRNIQKRKLDY